MASPLTVYSTNADGHLVSINADYPTARAGSSPGAYENTDNGVIGQLKNGATYYVWEFFVSFDTSEIPDDAEITSATLSLYPQSDASSTDFIIEARTFDWGAVITSADWTPGANLSGLTLLASYNTSGGWSGAAYKSLASEAAFLNAINKTGTTYVMLSSSRLRNGDAPSGNEYVGSWMANKGAGYQPRLVVEYGEAPPPASAAIMTANRGYW